MHLQYKFFKGPNSNTVVSWTAKQCGLGSLHHRVMRPPEEALSIRIDPYNAAIIRAKCDQLAPSVIAGRAEEQYYALQVLRHFHDSAAVPCLRSILDRTDLADMVIFEALKSIGTAETRRVLEDVAAGSSGDRAEMARSALVTFKRQ